MVEGLKEHPALAFWEVMNEAEGSFTPSEVTALLPTLEPEGWQPLLRPDPPGEHKGCRGS